AGIVFGSDYQVIEGEGYHYVIVSLTDVNRIVCGGGEITGVVYSREKSMEVRRKGANAWLKILPVKEGDRIEYPSYPREVYVECGGKIFSLIVLPKRRPATTIVLKVSREEREVAREFERLNPYERTILELVRSVYREVPPPGYTVRSVGEKVREFQEIDLYLLRVYTGARYEVREYLVRARRDIHLQEGQFIPFVPRPLAISLVKPSLRKGEETRLIVVSLREG
ncbi:MAG: type-F conjugative transfer system secretin TraK, partial [Aquificota bacterium]|nr:type-F conjugative transfer system secretin TraK [Aquificota bacterium]